MKQTLPALLLSLAAGLAFGDTVVTRDGRRLEGKTKDLGDEILLEGKFGSTKIPKNQIEKIEYGKTGRELYEEKVAALKDEDAKGHWALALWCKDAGLEGEYRKEAAKTIAADRNHEAARLALGHKLVDGVWMSPDEVHEANGEVKYKGEWMTQDEADRLGAEDKVRALLREAGGKDPVVTQNAIDALLKIRQDALLGPCSRVVFGGNRGAKIAAWKGIGRVFEWTHRSLGLVRDLQERFDKLGDLTAIALREKDDDVRAIAIAATRAFGDEYAGMWYQKQVVEQDGEAKLRAAQVLGEMGNAGSVPYLMMAWYTVYIEVRATNAVEVQDITDSYVDFIADPERRVITQPLRIETPKMAIQRARTTVSVPEGFHATANTQFGEVLGKMTGQSLGDDFEAWNKWYRTDGKSWVKERLADERAKREGAGK